MTTLGTLRQCPFVEAEGLITAYGGAIATENDRLESNFDKKPNTNAYSISELAMQSNANFSFK
jgi:hypothetical protein